MKFSGCVGFWEGDEEVSPGVYRPKIVERKYKGDVLRNYRKFQTTEYQNDDLRLNNQITILSDLYARNNFSSIRYVVWNGVKWKVDTVEVNYPKLTLEIGGVYKNGNDEEDETEPSRDVM